MGRGGAFELGFGVRPVPPHHITVAGHVPAMRGVIRVEDVEVRFPAVFTQFPGQQKTVEFVQERIPPEHAPALDRAF